MKAGDLKYDIIHIDILKSGILFMVSPDKETLIKNAPKVIRKEIVDKQHIKDLTKDLVDCFSKDRTLYPGTTFETFVGDGTQYLVVVLRNDLTDPNRILVHEMYHVVHKLFKECGIEDEEVFAYTLEYLFSKGRDIMEKFKQEDSPHKKK